MKKILKLAFVDFKIIFRDSSLKGMLALPLLLFGFIIWGIPLLLENYSFLAPYLSLFLIIAVIENTQTFSFISTMVLIDEKESDVAKIYGVVPLSKFDYIVSRFLIPYFFTVIMNVFLFIVQPFYEIGFGDNLLLSLVTAFIVPLYALTINSIVKNRVEGMIYIKAMNIIVLLPILAFFVPENYKHLFGIIPTHWIFQSVEQATQNLPIGLFLGVCFIILSIMFYFISKVFIRKHFV